MAFEPQLVGTLKLQLFEGSKCVLEKEQHNFLGLPFKRWMLSMGMGLFGYFTRASDGAKYSQFPQYNMISHFILSDNASAVATTETVFPGNVLGWANTATYSGTDTLRGRGINTIESGLQATGLEVKLVFDWPTNAANGTFQTLGFGRLNTGTSAATVNSVSRVLPMKEELQHLE